MNLLSLLLRVGVSLQTSHLCLSSDSVWSSSDAQRRHGLIPIEDAQRNLDGERNSRELARIKSKRWGSTKLVGLSMFLILAASAARARGMTAGGNGDLYARPGVLSDSSRGDGESAPKNKVGCVSEPMPILNPTEAVLIEAIEKDPWMQACNLRYQRWQALQERSLADVTVEFKRWMEEKGVDLDRKERGADVTPEQYAATENFFSHKIGGEELQLNMKLSDVYLAQDYVMKRIEWYIYQLDRVSETLSLHESQIVYFDDETSLVKLLCSLLEKFQASLANLQFTTIANHSLNPKAGFGELWALVREESQVMLLLVNMISKRNWGSSRSRFTSAMQLQIDLVKALYVDHRNIYGKDVFLQNGREYLREKLIRVEESDIAGLFSNLIREIPKEGKPGLLFPGW